MKRVWQWSCPFKTWKCFIRLDFIRLDLILQSPLYGTLSVLMLNYKTYKHRRMKIMSLAEKIFHCFKGAKTFSLKDAYDQNEDKPKETVRARIYENLGIKFERIAKGIYRTCNDGDEVCIVMEGDGRDLSMLEDGSIDCILTDHPWLDLKSNKGGTRAFATYDCFKYTLEDFQEKARVLKDGCFLVEILPAENENNYEYLYQIKQYAKEAGFLYYSKVTWKKGNFISNTGRKAKNTQDVMIFSKGSLLFFFRQKCLR